MTIKLHFFLEKRAIFLIFHCKYKSSTHPNDAKISTELAWYFYALVCQFIYNSAYRTWD